MISEEKLEAQPMDAKDIYAFLKQRERFPVRVVLRDGRSYEVASREFVVVCVNYLDIGYQLRLPNVYLVEGIWGPTTTVQIKDIHKIESLAATVAPSK
jgi:hypothetical protein